VINFYIHLNSALIGLKFFFTKFKNTSKLSIRESDKETEVATFLHADLKEGLYLRIKKQLNLY